jgi:hypothetical protein
MARKTHTYDGEVHPDEKSLRYIRTVRRSADMSTAEGAAATTLSDATAAAQGSAANSAPTLYTASAKAHKAMDIIGERMEDNNKAAAFEEIKVQTEQLLGL